MSTPHSNSHHSGHGDHSPSGHDHTGHGHVDHAGHDHDAHAGHDHSDHVGHDHADHSGNDHAGHDHSGHGHAGHDHSDHADHGGHGHGGHDHSDHSGHAGHGAHGGHAGHAGHGGHDHSSHVAQFRRLFWIMLILAVPVIAFNAMFASLLGYGLPDAAWVVWVSPILGTVMYVWGGRPFLAGGWDELKQRSPGMMLLIALAITVAFLSSWGATLGLLDHELDFWWELALLVVIMLLGHWIEMRSLARTSSALDSLAALLPDEAERVADDGTISTVPPEALVTGDVVLVRPGASVPADGRIISGSASLDESMITGESAPVHRGEGDPVVAGTVATDSGLRIEVTATGDDTTLSGISRLVADAQSSSSRAQRIADTAAGWLFWFALGAAALTAIVWAVLGMPDQAVVRTISVLVIACPHALGLAIPLVVSIATERAAKAGILVSDRLALESMRTVDTVVFDKTGTLTTGEPIVTAVAPAAGTPGTGGSAGEHGTAGDAGTAGTAAIDESTLLTWAAAAEAPSEHPLARAIVRAAEERGLEVPEAHGFASSPAVGVTAQVDGRTIRVGGPHLLEEEGADELPIADEWRRDGAIILHVLADGVPVGALSLADAIRDESAQTVRQLADAGIEVVMITGDARAVAESVAGELGIDRVFAGVRPEDKAAHVAQLQGEGRKVAMVGDGVNDAPALAQADVGIAIGAGTDVAIGSAGVVLASSDPRGVVSILELSKAAFAKMRQNLWWAAGYNIIAVPLAAGVTAPIGFVLPMSVGALLMSASTVVVALNAQLLRRLDLRPEVQAAGGEKAVAAAS